ncbi:hypothetical protein DERP_001362 [Dermatophagoides pteronyssinus]|uniref:Uncharacterized protein n=1 Tax=Dermatophagoides pteronyssinus TaxID=6956 RepID=A0ABQ8JEY0_DERPT|nr:hypothetical protein DERP_001362 [Dermatophagoides pteronyssinus]
MSSSIMYNLSNYQIWPHVFIAAGIVVSTLLIFLFLTPFGTCCLNVANPRLTILTRFLSRSFRLATDEGNGL